MSTRIAIRERWRSILQQQRSSGLSVSAFCRRSGVQCSGYYKWRRKLGDQATFSEVKLKAIPAMASRQTAMREAREIELLVGRRSVVVRAGFDRQTLIELLDILEAGSAVTARQEAER